MKISDYLPRVFCLMALASFVLTGCRNPKPVTYQTPKETEAPSVSVTPAAAPVAPNAAVPPGHPDVGNAPAAAPANAMGSTAVATASGAGLQWTAPSQWTAKPVSSMRKGSYTVAGDAGTVGDLAITAFPGDVGGEIANVNRWRGQLQLAPLPGAEATAAITRVTYNGLPIGVVDITNTATPVPQRILGAMVPFDGSTWFFKLTGPDPLVAKEKAAFLEFLKSVQPAASTP